MIIQVVDFEAGGPCERLGSSSIMWFEPNLRFLVNLEQFPSFVESLIKATHMQGDAGLLDKTTHDE